MKPLVSVILCTHNRWKELEECCHSLALQRASKEEYEVVIIDNASVDSTPEFIDKWILQPEAVNFRRYREDKTGLSHARNLGVEKCQAEYVGFIDDDALAPSDWIGSAISVIREEAPDIFGGPAFPIFPHGKPDWFREEYGIRGDMGESGLLPQEGYLVGTNIFFRKSLIHQFGGFNPELGMKGDQIAYHEETHLIRKAQAEGMKVWYAKELAVHDRIPEYKINLPFALYSKYRAGKDIWKSEIQEMRSDDIRDFLVYFDKTMEEFNTALMKRDRGLYPYPENYIFEKVRHNFYYLGRMAEYFLRKKIIGKAL